jgi:tetratricopeptide (TPR) repeat protein
MHVMRGELRSFFENRLDAGERNRLVRHLLAGCRTCRELASEVFGGEESSADHDAVFWRLMSSVTLRPSELRAQRVRAREQWEYLQKLSLAQQLLRITNDASYLTYGLYERLLEISKDTVRDDPRRAGDIARLAAAVATRLDPDVYGRDTLPETLATALAALGNAQRLASDFEGSAASLGEAERLLVVEGAGDPLDFAHIHSLTASLQTDLGRFGEALASLAKARAIYERLRDRHMIGRVGIQQAMAIGYVDPARGIALLTEAHALIDARREPRLELSIRHTTALFLCDLGRPQEALELLQRSRWLYHRFGDRAVQIRRLWLEAKIHRGLGELAEAEEILTGTTEELRRQGLSQECVLMTIDLAENLAAQGRHAETADLVGQIHGALQAWGMHEEGLAVLLLAQRSLREQTIQEGMFRELTAYMRRAWHRPQKAG